MSVTARLFNIVGEYVLLQLQVSRLNGSGSSYIGPRNEIIGGVFEGLYQRVLNDLVRESKSACIFDQLEAWLDGTGIPSANKVGLKIGNTAVHSIRRLFGNGCEE